jgi:hypothetical protein
MDNLSMEEIKLLENKHEIFFSLFIVIECSMICMFFEGEIENVQYIMIPIYLAFGYTFKLFIETVTNKT